MAIELPLQAVEELLQSVTTSSVPLLNEMCAHILAAGGKRLRPRLVLLSYEAAGGTAFDTVVPLAAAVEVIHTATLVHDDINDHGTLRRGRETVNSRWGSTFALLTGDYMFTITYQIMAPYSPELNLILAQAAAQLVEGETLQIHAAHTGQLDRATYMEIITKKTAALFIASVELGALSANAPQAWIDALRRYARNLGLAFQITDDLLDLVADPQQIGKNTGIDRAQGRGIAAVHEGRNRPGGVEAPAVEAAPDTAPAPLAESMLGGQAVETAIEIGRAKARELVDEALASLDVLPPSPAREQLRALVSHIVDRDH